MQLDFHAKRWNRPLSTIYQSAKNKKYKKNISAICLDYLVSKNYVNLLDYFFHKNSSNWIFLQKDGIGI